MVSSCVLTGGVKKAFCELLTDSGLLFLNSLGNIWHTSLQKLACKLIELI